MNHEVRAGRDHGDALATKVMRLLLTIIPAERGCKLVEEATPYEAEIDQIDLIPMP